MAVCKSYIEVEELTGHTISVHTGEAPVDRVFVQWKPHACISGGLPDKDGRSTTLGPNTLTATMSATTRVGSVASMSITTILVLVHR